MTDRTELEELANLLMTEICGGMIDRRRAQELARRLMPTTPELRHTLASVSERMSRSPREGGPYPPIPCAG